MSWPKKEIPLVDAMWWPGLRELRRGLGVVPESPGAQGIVEGVTGKGKCWSGKKMKKAGDQVLARIYCYDWFPRRWKGPWGPADLGSAIGLAPQSPGLLGG